MSIEIIKSIRQAEAEAEQILMQSVTEARELTSEAHKQSAKLKQQEIDRAEKEAQVIIQNAEHMANVQIEKMKEEILDECRDIRKQAMKSMDKAVEIIMGRIVKTHGNS